ncbi:MAG: hypothetical protein ACFB4J_12140 [Elainellaceae cyanobacterium]
MAEKQLSPQERQDWRQRIATANYNNIYCRCRRCAYEWVTSAKESCPCGSASVEAIACWQFPDG